MINAAEITDSNSFDAWLQGQRFDTAISIIARAVLRLLPHWTYFCGTDAARESQLSPIPVLRGSIVLAVAASRPNDDRVIEAADEARLSLTSAVTSIIDAASAANVLVGTTVFAPEGVALAAAEACTLIGVHPHLWPSEMPNLAKSIDIQLPALHGGEVWHNVRVDALQSAPGAKGLSQSLWARVDSPLQEQWNRTRRDWTVPDAPFAFWLRWYDSVLDPRLHPAFPDEMLFRVATEIDNDTWDAGPEAVADAIREIEAEYAGDAEDVDKRIAAMPPAPADRVAATKLAMERYRADLPATFGSVLGFIALEVERLQTRNCRDADDEEEAKRQIRTLTTLYRTVERLQTLVPKTDDMPTEDAEKAEKLARLYLSKFRDWPRDHVDDVVGGVYTMGVEIAGNTIRMGLVAATAFALPMIGVPTPWALGAGIAVFGNKTIADAAKFVQESVFAKST